MYWDVSSTDTKKIVFSWSVFVEEYHIDVFFLFFFFCTDKFTYILKRKTRGHVLSKIVLQAIVFSHASHWFDLGVVIYILMNYRLVNLNIPGSIIMLSNMLFSNLLDIYEKKVSFKTKNLEKCNRTSFTKLINVLFRICVLMKGIQ